MPDDEYPPTTITARIAHPRGFTVEVTATVGTDTINRRVGYAEFNRIVAEHTAAAVADIITVADEPPF